MSEPESRAYEIFSAAAQLSSPEERSQYLEATCGDDTELRRRVEGLLEAHGAMGQFLEAPVVNVPTTLAQPELSERPGVVIDRYKLLQQIGEGAFGVVFMAEQQEPVRRRVALKVIKPGMDSKEVVARFESERQALALMDHPNIARVFDGGATDAGRPYFVMELVKGVPISDYCDKNDLTTDERLSLFVDVANGTCQPF